MVELQTLPWLAGVGVIGAVVTLAGIFIFLRARRRDDWPRSASLLVICLLVATGILSLALTGLFPTVSVITNLSSGQSDEVK